MKKREVLQGMLILVLVLGAIAVMDYFFVGLNSNRRGGFIFIFIFLGIFLGVKLFPVEEDEQTKEPFFISFISFIIATIPKEYINQRLGLLDTYPFFNEEQVFDGRSLLSFLVFLVLLITTNFILRKLYLLIQCKKR